MAKAALPIVVLQRWQTLKREQRLVVIVLGSLLGVWLVDRIALRPMRRHVGLLRQQVKQTEEQLLNAVAANHNAAAVTRAFKAYEPYAQSSALAESELANLLSEIESSVRQSGMVLLNLKPAGKPSGSETAIGVVIDAESTPEQLVRVLDQLQRSPRVLKVSELSVRVSEQKTLRLSMIVSMLLLSR